MGLFSSEDRMIDWS